MSIEVKTEATCAKRKEDALMSAFNDYYKHKLDFERLDKHVHRVVRRDEHLRTRVLVMLIESEQEKIGFFKTISFGATQETKSSGKRLRISANNVLDSFLDMKQQLQMIELEQAFEEGIAEHTREVA